jgi:hypothetical protein
MIRAPIDKTGSHLYGMSAYLIPRKKPTELARLIIDFSPLTNIIQSPPAIVPDIGAALQHLKGKAMFSSTAPAPARVTSTPLPQPSGRHHNTG